MHQVCLLLLAEIQHSGLMDGIYKFPFLLQHEAVNLFLKGLKCFFVFFFKKKRGKEC